jgi:hypothetical protein
MAQSSLLIIFQVALGAFAFLFLHMPQVAGWLWTKLQAARSQHGKALLLSATSPPLI